MSTKTVIFKKSYKLLYLKKTEFQMLNAEKASGRNIDQIFQQKLCKSPLCQIFATSPTSITSRSDVFGLKSGSAWTKSQSRELWTSDCVPGLKVDFLSLISQDMHLSKYQNLS